MRLVSYHNRTKTSVSLKKDDFRMACPVFAAIDIGTNTVLLLVARWKPDGDLDIIEELSTTTRLGAGLSVSGEVTSGAIERTVSAMADYAAAAGRITQSGTGTAAATSALRDASNAALFVRTCRKRLGWAPRIFTGEEEARTTFLGAASDRSPARLVITLDIGGGSTELGAGWPEHCQYAASLNLGCVHLSEQFGLLSNGTEHDLENARIHVRRLLAPTVSAMAALNRGADRPDLVVSGGTATTLAAVDRGLQTYRRDLVHGHRLADYSVEALLQRLTPMSEKERAAVPGISCRRAAILPAGLLILSEVLNLLKMKELCVTVRGLRAGIVVRLRDQDLEPTWSWAQ